mmetsp:Transcript_46449/g.105895  ORF Transcript_46449/g.105895 Transcript_46449/m.105895 type:complete len:431 (-) Transcript_46449:563-1855(-)
MAQAREGANGSSTLGRRRLVVLGSDDIRPRALARRQPHALPVLHGPFDDRLPLFPPVDGIHQLVQLHQVLRPQGALLDRVLDCRGSEHPPDLLRNVVPDGAVLVRESESRQHHRPSRRPSGLAILLVPDAPRHRHHHRHRLRAVVEGGDGRLQHPPTSSTALEPRFRRLELRAHAVGIDPEAERRGHVHQRPPVVRLERHHLRAGTRADDGFSEALRRGERQLLVGRQAREQVRHPFPLGLVDVEALEAFPRPRVQHRRRTHLGAVRRDEKADEVQELLPLLAPVFRNLGERNGPREALEAALEREHLGLVDHHKRHDLERDFRAQKDLELGGRLWAGVLLHQEIDGVDRHVEVAGDVRNFTFDDAHEVLHLLFQVGFRGHHRGAQVFEDPINRSLLLLRAMLPVCFEHLDNCVFVCGSLRLRRLDQPLP